MILRVYAIWNQSKGILYILLFLYVPQVILSFVFAGMYFGPNLNANHSGMSEAQLWATLEPHIWLIVSTVPIASHCHPSY